MLSNVSIREVALITTFDNTTIYATGSSRTVMSDPETKRRITDYTEAGPKTRVVVDYCARYRLVPREKDAKSLPPTWQAVSSSEVRDRIAADFGVDLSERQPAFVWERLGANIDVASALTVLKNRREAFLDAGVEQLAEWEVEKI